MMCDRSEYITVSHKNRLDKPIEAFIRHVGMTRLINVEKVKRFVRIVAGEKKWSLLASLGNRRDQICKYVNVENRLNPTIAMLTEKKIKLNLTVDQSL